MASDDDAGEEALFLMSAGLDLTGSVAVQLADVRKLIAKLRDHETKLERWARSGDFVLAVPGESVRIVIGEDGALLLVHEGEANA